MQYMILIYSALDAGPQSEQEMMESMPAWFGYTEEMAAAGVLVGGDALQGTDTATTVRVRGDKRSVTDGPFAETKEVLGGYYLIDVNNLDEALGWAEKCPSVSYGSIEVRPLMELPEAP